MTTLVKVKEAALKLGAVVSDDKIGETHSCMVDAPHGFVFACSDLHCIVDSTNRPWKPDYADLLGRMAYGIKPCETPDCEWCNDED